MRYTKDTYAINMVLDDQLSFREKFMCYNNIVSAVYDHGVDYRVSISGKGKEFFLWPLHQPLGSGAHPVPCPMGTGGPFPGGKARPGRDADHSPHLVPRSRTSRSYTSSAPKRLHGV
jgi:hypothetical protein